MEEGMSRQSTIVRTSIIGILANIFLTVFKIIIGLLANSIAVLLDGINNLSDALSSVVTIVGTSLAAKAPDKKHPMGHGRLEYLSTLIVAAIVLYAGISSLIESFKKIIHPEESDYSVTALIIIAVAVLVKIVLGTYVSGVGKRVNSGALAASGKDALFDAILSFSVLICALLSKLLGLTLEPYVGIIISVFIIKAGLEMMVETVDDILGKRVEGELLSEIKKTICTEKEVHGAYDLILHSYGPDNYIGSVHVEIDNTLGAVEIDRLTRRITENVYKKHGIILTGVGIYSLNPDHKDMQEKIYTMVRQHEGVLQIHGFFYDKPKETINFDIILDFDLEDRAATCKTIYDEVSSAFPDQKINITMDIDF